MTKKKIKHITKNIHVCGTPSIFTIRALYSIRTDTNQGDTYTKIRSAEQGAIKEQNKVTI